MSTFLAILLYTFDLRDIDTKKEWHAIDKTTIFARMEIRTIPILRRYD